MKLIYSIFITVILSFQSAFLDQFDSKVDEAYSEYIVLREYTNSYYTIKIVYGIVNDDIRYGVCFYSHQAHAYNINIKHQGQLYSLPKNNRGDVSAIALNLNAGESFSIIVYDRDNHLQYPFESFSNIEIISKESFNTLENKITGQNSGSSLTKLKIHAEKSPLLGVYVVMVSLILFCGLVIFIFYKKQKGMFAQGASKQGVFNFKEFINSVIEEETVEEEKVDEVEEDRIDSESSDSYEPISNYKWIRNEEEERSDFNIKRHLDDLGFMTNYQIASEDEKNQIMLELMKLRDYKQITKDEYLEETRKLWLK